MRRIFVRMGCADIFQVIFEWFEMRLGKFVLFIDLDGQKEIGGFGQLAMAIIIHYMKIV